MHISIYADEKPIILTEDTDKDLDTWTHDPSVLLMDEISHGTMHTVMHEIKKPEISKVVISAGDLSKLKDFFFHHFTVIHAGGGLVENENGEYLIIFRRGKWDLPKGKMDEGETPEECAVREVKEETGLDHITLTSHRLNTYHIYTEYGKKILKETYWYNMKVSGPQSLTPQTEEDIEEVKWIRPEDWKLYANDSYASIRDVIRVD
jgi:8-oxo-dGTP pyrophosphatase MutT (NUDIX family)